MLTEFISGTMCTTAHNECELVGVICVAQFVDLNRIVIKKVDEFRKQLNLNEPVVLCCPGIILQNFNLIFYIVVLTNERLQHFEDDVGVFFSLEKSKKHSLENRWSNNTPLVINHLVELLSEVVQDAQIKVKSVNLFNDFDPTFARTVLHKRRSRTFLKNAFDILVNDCGSEHR